MAELSQPSASGMTEEQYRALCKQVRQYQLKNGKAKKKAKPILNNLGDVEALDLKAKIQKSQVDFDYLKIGMPFVTDITATLVYVKTAKERAMCINTFQSVAVGGGMVHRIFL